MTPDGSKLVVGVHFDDTNGAYSVSDLIYDIHSQASLLQIIEGNDLDGSGDCTVI